MSPLFYKTLAVLMMLMICVSASDNPIVKGKERSATAAASDLSTANSYGLGYGLGGYGGYYSGYPHYYAPATSYSIKYHGYPNYVNHYGLGYGGYGLYGGYGYGHGLGYGYKYGLGSGLYW